MKKISVIVPVYNVEKYLDKCLASLTKQTLKDIEVIIVNDGSTDNSQNIIDKYVKKYDNFKAYKKSNGGLSSARNYGLKYAKGEYIAFLDSDDYIASTMYEKMYNKAIKNDYDIVVCDSYNINLDGSNKILVSSLIANDITDTNMLKKSMINIYPVAWNKLYNKRVFTHDVFFKENIWYEDVEFLYRLFPFIKSIGVIKEPLYYYVQRQGAISKTFDKRLFDYISNFNGIIKFYKKNGFYDEYKKELEYVYVRYLYATFIKNAANFEDKKSFDEAVNMAICNVKENFKHYRLNKYFYKSLKGIYLVCFNKWVANIVYKKIKRNKSK